MKMITILKLAFSVALLGVLIFVVSKAVNIEDLNEIIFDFPKKILLLLFVTSFAISAVKSYRFLLLLRNCDVDINYFEALKVSIAGGAISPLPGGEAFKRLLLNYNRQTKVHNTTGPIVTQAYLEMVSAAIMAVIGSLIFKVFWIPSTIALVLLVAFAAVLVNHKIPKYIFGKLPNHKFLQKFQKSFKIIQQGTRENIIDLDTMLPDKVFIKTLVISIAAHALGGLLFLLISQYYGVPFNLLKGIFIYSLGIIITGFGNITPGGIGFTEGGMTGVLLLMGVNLPQALAIVVLYRFVTLIFNVLLGIIFILLFYPKILFRRKKSSEK